MSGEANEEACQTKKVERLLGLVNKARKVLFFSMPSVSMPTCHLCQSFGRLGQRELEVHSGPTMKPWHLPVHRRQ